MPPRILIVDNDPAARQVMGQALSEEGFRVHVTPHGPESVAFAAKVNPDLMIVNLHRPDLESAKLCQIIRKTPQVRTTPLLVLSGDHVAGLSVQCLNHGADAYLVKPIDSLELLAHVHAILRRPKIYVSDDAVIRKGRITLRLGERKVIFDGKDIVGLTPKEYEILKELTFRSPRVIEKHGLVMKIWGMPLEQLGRRTLDVHIQRLRRKLGRDASSHLKTIPLVGYQWMESSKP